MKTVIAGCGFVGSRLAEILMDSGQEVLALRRSRPTVPSTIQYTPVDLTNPDSLASVDLTCDFAVYCAAADAHTEEAYHSAYVLGLERFLEQLKIQSPRVRRVVFTSSTGVYGQDDGSWVDEDSPTQPDRFSGKKVLEGEGVLLASGLPAIALRYGGIYGPGRTRMLQSISEGRAKIPSHPAFTNRIHREDCARSIAHLLELESPDEIYNGVDNDPCDRAEFYGWLASEMGATLPKEDSSQENLTTGKRVRNDRLVRSGYRFVYPSFREGYRQMLEDWDREK